MRTVGLCGYTVYNSPSVVLYCHPLAQLWNFENKIFFVVITRKQLLLCQDHKKIKSWSRENNFCYVEITRKISRDNEKTTFVMSRSRQPMTSLPARARYKGCRENTSFTSSSEACVRSMAYSLGDAVSRSPSGKHGYIRNLRRSPSWELRTASPRGRYWGTLIPTPPCWGECKPISRKRRALSQLYQAKGVAPGTVWWLSVTLSPSAKNPSCIP